MATTMGRTEPSASIYSRRLGSPNLPLPIQFGDNLGERGAFRSHEKPLPSRNRRRVPPARLREE